jgi:predicted acylesterase/phospholipase RssA
LVLDYASQGVVKALREQGLLPRVIAGSSVGSIGALLLAAFCVAMLHTAPLS